MDIQIGMDGFGVADRYEHYEAAGQYLKIQYFTEYRVQIRATAAKAVPVIHFSTTGKF